MGLFRKRPEPALLDLFPSDRRTRVADFLSRGAEDRAAEDLRTWIAAVPVEPRDKGDVIDLRCLADSLIAFLETAGGAHHMRSDDFYAELARIMEFPDVWTAANREGLTRLRQARS